jgi:hypothetical protein
LSPRYMVGAGGWVVGDLGVVGAFVEQEQLLHISSSGKDQVRLPSCLSHTCTPLSSRVKHRRSLSGEGLHILQLTSRVVQTQTWKTAWLLHLE